MSAPMPQLDGVSHHYTQIGANKIHYAEMGSGEPVVLLHGWPQHWYVWRFVMPKLAERYRVICPDLRGFGWSDAPLNDAYYKEDLAQDVIALIEQLELSNVRLMGHDWGGYCGFIISVRRPDLISRYIALNICHLWPGKSSEAITNCWRFAYQWVLSAPKLGTWLLEKHPELLEKSLIASSSRHYWSREELQAYSRVLQEPARARASQMLYRTFVLREFMPLLRGKYKNERLRVPTYVLHGTHDPVVRPWMLEGYEPYAENMSVEFTDTSNHFIAEDNPELVVERALEFFAVDKIAS